MFKKLGPSSCSDNFLIILMFPPSCSKHYIYIYNTHFPFSSPRQPVWALTWDMKFHLYLWCSAEMLSLACNLATLGYNCRPEARQLLHVPDLVAAGNAPWWRQPNNRKTFLISWVTSRKRKVRYLERIRNEKNSTQYWILIWRYFKSDIWPQKACCWLNLYLRQILNKLPHIQSVKKENSWNSCGFLSRQALSAGVGQDPGFTLSTRFWLIMWPWANHLTSLVFCQLRWKMR